MLSIKDLKRGDRFIDADDVTEPDDYKVIEDPVFYNDKWEVTAVSSGDYEVVFTDATEDRLNKITTQEWLNLRR